MPLSQTGGQPASTTNRTLGSAIAAVVRTVMTPPLRHTGHGDVIRGNAGCSEPRDLAGNRQCIGLDIGVRTARLADDDEFTIGKRLDRPAPVIAGADGAGGAHQFDDPAVHVEEIAGAWIDLRWHVVEDFPVWMNRHRSAGSYSNHNGQH